LEAYNCKVTTGKFTTETISFAASGGKDLKKRKANNQGTGGGKPWLARPAAFQAEGRGL